MKDSIIPAAYRVGSFYVSDIYAYYQDTYKGSLVMPPNIKPQTMAVSACIV